MNRKSVLGTVLVGGKKEILSILSIDSSIPIILTRGVGDRRKSEKSGKEKEEASRWDLQGGGGG